MAGTGEKMRRSLELVQKNNPGGRMFAVAELLTCGTAFEIWQKVEEGLIDPQSQVLVIVPDSGEVFCPPCSEGLTRDSAQATILNKVSDDPQDVISLDNLPPRSRLV